ncbi:hypothetical protein B7494_g7140 [Chlorociboria aeruginascens]|nr:hypothetical protein B7494_g7140 [Chlorociboria aeruginascens]
MRSLHAVTIATCFACVHAFKNTSPFLLFSSSQAISESPIPSTLQSSAQVLHHVKAFLKGCPSDLYIVVSQPSLLPSDITHNAPFLKSVFLDQGLPTRVAIPEVVGWKAEDVDDLRRFIVGECGEPGGLNIVDGEVKDLRGDVAGLKAGGGKLLVMGRLDGLEEGKMRRGELLEINDALLYTTLLDDFPKGYKYTVIYASTPLTSSILEDYTYEPQFPGMEHMDLKRDFGIRDEGGNKTEVDTRPLFEKYQYFTPGIFMGLLVGLILLSILSVGIKAVSSLQVSYAAFDKEMGPAAQKKQQ